MEIRQSTRDKYIGKVYGYVTVLEVTRRDSNNPHHYFVFGRCKCGTEREFRLSNLQRTHGHATVSCGCYGKEQRRKANIGNTRQRHEAGANAQRTVFGRYVIQARKSGRTFDLTLDELVSIASQPCYYCGAPPSNVCTPGNAHGSFIYSGIDRVDNSLGYSRLNCVAACKRCNGVKNAMPKDMVFKLYHLLFPHTAPAPELDASPVQATSCP